MDRTTIVALLASLLSLACQPTDPVAGLEACADQACRTEALLPAWQADPARARVWLLGLDDPLVQTTLIERLALELPDEAAALCRELPERGHARTRCERHVVRPHLRGHGKPQSRAEPAAAAAGPRSATLPLLTLPDPPWQGATPAELEAALTGCEAGNPQLCGRLISREHAAEGRWEQAGLACRAGDPDAGKVNDECLFQAAEVLAEQLGAAGLGDALRLCSWSRFGPMCVAHSLTLAGPAVPPVESLSTEDVARASAVVQAIRQVSTDQPDLGENWVDRYWSSWTFTTFSHARQPAGALDIVLPPEAAPHLPVAVAARLLADRDPQHLQMDVLVNELRAAMAEAPKPATTATERQSRLVTWHQRQTWPSDRKLERQIPAAWVMGPGRRALVVDDREADLQICVLEAAAQLREPPPASFFLAVVGDPERHRLVRWTGARIGGFLDPQAASLLDDLDPLVQATLDQPRKVPGGQGKGPKQGAAHRP
jgi:hypothetical protein